MNTWEEIHGFISLGEYEKFVKYICDQAVLGYAEEVKVDNNYGQGEIYGGRWFRNIDTGEIWRLVSPDPPFHGLWEKVRRRS